MKKMLLIWGILFISSSLLHAISMRGEIEKSDYNIVSMISKIVIQCENNRKVFIKKRKNLYYASKHKSFNSFEKAAKYACDLKSRKKISKKRINAKLRKNALVCRTKKSMIYTLKNDRNYQSVLHKLESRNLYKNCFIGVKNYKVIVTNHYHNENLIKNYYKMKYGDNIRYAPINSIKPLNKRKRYKKRHVYKKDIKRNFKHKKIVKYRTPKSKTMAKHKRVYTHAKKEKMVKSKFIAPNTKRVTNVVKRVKSVNSYVETEYKPEIIRYSDSSENISEIQSTDSIQSDTSIGNQEIADERLTRENSNDTIDTSSTYKSIEKKPKIVQHSNTKAVEVYRCSASSTLSGKIYIGQHLDRDSSVKLALKNCKDEHKNVENCQFEHCFILKLM